MTIIRDLRLARLGLKELLGIDKYMEVKKRAKKKKLALREKVFRKGNESSDAVSTDPLSGDDTIKRAQTGSLFVERDQLQELEDFYEDPLF